MNQNKKSINTLNLEVMLTHNCNFRCKYCYEKPCNYQKENISDEVIEKIFRYVKWYLNENPDSDVRINFWGGEPSLRVEEIHKFVENFLNEQRVSFLIFTNGFLIDPIIEISKKCNSIQPNKFYTQISYDFAGQGQRIFAAGQPTKNYILDSIRKMALQNLPMSTKSTILLNDLPKIHLYYKEFLDLRKELKLPNFNLAVTPDTTVTWTGSDDEFNCMISAFKKSLKELLKMALREKDHGFNWFSKNIRRLCTSGKSYFSVDINGDVYPCHGVIFLENKEKLYLGNISDLKKFDLLFDIFKEPKVCQSCDSCICFRCNAHTVLNSNKEKIDDAWLDFGNNRKHCEIMKEISKITYAYQKIKFGRM